MASTWPLSPGKQILSAIWKTRLSRQATECSQTGRNQNRRPSTRLATPRQLRFKIKLPRQKQSRKRSQTLLGNRRRQRSRRKPNSRCQRYRCLLFWRTTTSPFQWMTSKCLAVTYSKFRKSRLGKIDWKGPAKGRSRRQSPKVLTKAHLLRTLSTHQREQSLCRLFPSKRLNSIRKRVTLELALGSSSQVRTTLLGS